MMKLCKTFFLISMLWCTVALAQNDSINRLERVAVVAIKSKTEVIGLKQQKISEEQKNNNSSNLTEVLRYNSPIIFKDYGKGGISTASFRGTSATNTQVLWNGIGINSLGSGQTDFNAISPFLADEISVVSGGNSVENGSGAIGGVIRLDNVLTFNTENKGNLYVSYGSFNTKTSYAKYMLSKDKWSVRFTATHNNSDNDYKYIENRYKNEDEETLSNLNGSYSNIGFGTSIGYKFKNNSKLYFYSSYYDGDRSFSAGFPNPAAGNEKQEDKNIRNLLKWEVNNQGYFHSFKAAYLAQGYKYFSESSNTDRFFYGNSKQGTFLYDVSKRFSRSVKMALQLGMNNIEGETNDKNSRRKIDVYQVLHFKYQPIRSLKTSLSVRNENSTFYKLPVVYTLGLNYNLFHKINLKGNYSTNYRQPTNNELFWPVVGNLDLLPETSKQYDLGVSFKDNRSHISLTYFSIDLKNKILWLPVGTGNLWRPENVDSVLNKGVELYLKTSLDWDKLNIAAQGNYSYINSINQETKNKIPFVPTHSFNYNISFSYKKVKTSFQQLFQSKVYTSVDQIARYSLDKLRVSNLSFDYDVFKKENRSIKIGAKVNNVFNTIYYFTNLRPMPGRNYNVNINYKF